MRILYICAISTIISLTPQKDARADEISGTIYKKYGVEVVIRSGNTAENQEWLLAIKSALDLLSESGIVLKQIIKNEGRILRFYLTESPESSTAGSYFSDEHVIVINEIPKFTDLFGDIRLWDNGFLRTTKIYVLMHELGHAYDFSKGQNPAMDLYNSIIKKGPYHEDGGPWDFIESLSEMPPSKYPFLFCDDNFNLTEDFAESFALYVVWPGVLKKEFPKRYTFFKKIFRSEFKDSGVIQGAVKARLFKKNEEIKCIYRNSVTE